jgi:hypothetical protein
MWDRLCAGQFVQVGAEFSSEGGDVLGPRDDGQYDSR